MEASFAITSETQKTLVVVDLDLLIKQLMLLSHMLAYADKPAIEELEGAKNLLETFINISGEEMKEKLDTAYESIGI